MTWKADEIDWLSLENEKEFERAITELLSSNPVLNGRVSRPTSHANLRELTRDVGLVVQRELGRGLRNPHAYESSYLLQQVIVDSVNKYLIIRHYTFMLLQCRPKPPYCPISPGQVWFPASYFIVKGRDVFDWKYRNPTHAFYDSSEVKGRRPVITLRADNDNLYTMVPCSHSKSGTSVRIDLGDGNTFVSCYFVFRASWVMLYGDRNAANHKGLRVKSSDFEILQLMIKDSLK